MKNKKAFTVVELVIVIAIIAILAAVLIPTFASIIKKANQSADIQAARNMNTHLAAANVTGDIQSILDVYDLFEESGYKVDSYSSLVSGTSYYYDKGYNQILYVDDATGKVLFPDEHKDETSAGREWFSLNMTIDAKAPETYTYTEGSEMTATVTDGAEYAFVVEQYNKATSGTTLNLTINGTIDLKGAALAIKATKGAVTITGTNNAVIKNVTSNKFYETSTNNTNHIQANYTASALIGTAAHDVSIKDVTFENLNVKGLDVGNVSLICASVNAGKWLTLENITIKNSTVIGQRSVGALMGAGPGSDSTALWLKGNIAMDNVNVFSTGGRSALLFTLNLGQASSHQVRIQNTASITLTNSNYGLYITPECEQEIVDTSITSLHEKNLSDAISNADKNVYSVKTFNPLTYVLYNNKDGALAIDYNSSATPCRKAIMTVEELMALYSYSGS